MSLDVEDAIRTGIDRTTARTGVLIIAAWFVVAYINALVGLAIRRWLFERYQFAFEGPSPDVATAPFAINPLVGALISVLAGILTIVLTIGAIRTFHADVTDDLDAQDFTSNLLWPSLNIFIGTIVFAIIIGIGLLLLIIPGLYLLAALAFWPVFVATEDENFITAMQSSWGLTNGHRWRMFLLGVVVFIISILVGIVFGFAPGHLGLLLDQIATAITTIFSLATIVAAYHQLQSLDTDEDQRATSDEDTSDVTEE